MAAGDVQDSLRGVQERMRSSVQAKRQSADILQRMFCEAQERRPLVVRGKSCWRSSSPEKREEHLSIESRIFRNSASPL